MRDNFQVYFVVERITAAVEKVELLWRQAFSKARLQLQVFQLREDALQVSYGACRSTLSRFKPQELFIPHHCGTIVTMLLIGSWCISTAVLPLLISTVILVSMTFIVLKL